MSETLALEVRELTVGYAQPGGKGVNTVVWNVNLALEPGRFLGLAGESGCGKSTSALAAIGYRSDRLRVLGGTSRLGNVDLLSCSTEQLREIWGYRVAYVPQGAATALNPAIDIGTQLREPLVRHLGLRGKPLLMRQVELLERLGIESPNVALKRFPHQFSGGQVQRIVLAIALSCNPTILILDEPTSGVDVTTQQTISDLLQQLVRDLNTSVLFVSHDVSLLGTIADRIAVMYGGQIVEEGTTQAILRRPTHPYTHGLIAAIPDAMRPRILSGIPGQPPVSVVKEECPFTPRCAYAISACRSANPSLRVVEEGHTARCIRSGQITYRPGRPVTSAASIPTSISALLEVDQLWCSYRVRGVSTPVVKDVSFQIFPRETVGIVGESGSGKSTIIRAIVGLHKPFSGAIRFDGEVLPALAIHRPTTTRRDVQLVFQNPDSSLNPRHTVLQLVGRPIRLFRKDVTPSNRGSEVRRLLEAVKLPFALAHRYPAELSGGQKQRVAIARAFAPRPKLLLCDEITSALDVSVQATILELIADLSAEFGTAVAFVSHDLSVVRTIAHRAVVIQLGQVCESGGTEDLFKAPRHPYTRSLLRSIPSLAAAGRDLTPI